MVIISQKNNKVDASIDHIFYYNHNINNNNNNNKNNNSQEYGYMFVESNKTALSTETSCNSTHLFCLILESLNRTGMKKWKENGITVAGGNGKGNLN